MQTTLTIDDELFVNAVQFAAPGIEKSELLREGVYPAGSSPPDWRR